MLHGAARAGKKKRLETIRDLDAAALVLRDVARVVRDPRCRDAASDAVSLSQHSW